MLPLPQAVCLCLGVCCHCSVHKQLIRTKFISIWPLDLNWLDHGVLRLKVYFDLAWINARCPPKLLYHSPSSTGQGRGKYDERLMGRDKDRERSLTNYCHGQNRLNLGRKGSLIYHQSNQTRIVRNKSRS